MKKLFLIALLIISSLSAFSQKEDLTYFKVAFESSYLAVGKDTFHKKGVNVIEVTDYIIVIHTDNYANTFNVLSFEDKGGYIKGYLYETLTNKKYKFKMDDVSFTLYLSETDIIKMYKIISVIGK